MRIDISQILPVETVLGNQVFNIYWKKETEPDSAYRQENDVQVNAAGTVILPNPYFFETGTTSDNINVKAVSTCDPSFFYIVLVPKVGMCCPSGYTLSPDGLTCSITTIEDPTIVQAGVCVACSELSNNYGIFGTKFWATNNYNGDLSDSNFNLLTSNYWIGNPVGGATSVACDGSGPLVGNPPSPVNRQGVWLDSDCDGNKNALTGGAALQFTWLINSPTAAQVFVGMSGDNNFTLTINGATIVSRPTTGGQANFRYFYLFPVNLISGANYIGASFIGDGTTSDMGAMIIIQNSAAQIPTITDDSQISYLFQTSQMIGTTPIDIATCNPGFTLDTSGGSGNYKCIKVDSIPSTPC